MLKRIFALLAVGAVAIGGLTATPAVAAKGGGHGGGHGGGGGGSPYT